MSARGHQIVVLGGGDDPGLTTDDFIPQVRDILSVGEFYELVAGGQVIFT